MTLSTNIALQGWTDPQELHDWINKNLLGSSDVTYDVKDTSIVNLPGQGVSAWLITKWEADQADFVFFDAEKARADLNKWVGKDDYTQSDADEEFESDRKYYEGYPTGVKIMLDFDTGYAFREDITTPDGSVIKDAGCSTLHAYFIHRLATEYLAPRGIPFSWQNEFTGDWFEGLTGFEEFADGGREALDWFENVAKPAIVADIIARQNEEDRVEDGLSEDVKKWANPNA